jgi:hypothetical protein
VSEHRKSVCLSQVCLELASYVRSSAVLKSLKCGTQALDIEMLKGHAPATPEVGAQSASSPSRVTIDLAHTSFGAVRPKPSAGLHAAEAIAASFCLSLNGTLTHLFLQHTSLGDSSVAAGALVTALMSIDTLEVSGVPAVPLLQHAQSTAGSVLTVRTHSTQPTE